jgi:hypothetical protein
MGLGRTDVSLYVCVRLCVQIPLINLITFYNKPIFIRYKSFSILSQSCPCHKILCESKAIPVTGCGGI